MQNMRTQKNLNPCPGMRGKSWSEHLALWCCPATITKRRYFLDFFRNHKFLIFLHWWQWLARIRVPDWDLPPTNKIVHQVWTNWSSWLSKLIIRFDKIDHQVWQNWSSWLSKLIIKFDKIVHKVCQNSSNKHSSVIHKKLKDKRSKKWKQVVAAGQVAMTQDVILKG